jgi:hypothetical protein
MSQQDRLNDELLVLRSQDGDGEAFELLVGPMAAAIVAARLAAIGCGSSEVPSNRDDSYDATCSWPWSSPRRMNHQPTVSGTRNCAMLMHILRVIDKPNS